MTDITAIAVHYLWISPIKGLKLTETANILRRCLLHIAMATLLLHIQPRQTPLHTRLSEQRLTYGRIYLQQYIMVEELISELHNVI